MEEAATAGFQIDEEITDPATGEKWIVLNVGTVFDDDLTFLHLIHPIKKHLGLRRDTPVQKACLVNRITGEHTKAPW